MEAVKTYYKTSAQKHFLNPPPTYDMFPPLATLLRLPRNYSSAWAIVRFPCPPPFAVDRLLFFGRCFELFFAFSPLFGRVFWWKAGGVRHKGGGVSVLENWSGRGSPMSVSRGGTNLVFGKPCLRLLPKSERKKKHISCKKKAHKHKLFVRLVLGRPRVCPGDFTGFVPGTNPVKTWDNPGFLLILHSGSPISPGLSLGQTRFVPGTIPGTKGGTESLCEKSLCAFFAR